MTDPAMLSWLMVMAGAMSMFLAGPVWFVAFIQSDNAYDSTTWRRTAKIGWVLFFFGAASFACAASR